MLTCYKQTCSSKRKKAGKVLRIRTKGWGYNLNSVFREDLLGKVRQRQQPEGSGRNRQRSWGRPL